MAASSSSRSRKESRVLALLFVVDIDLQDKLVRDIDAVVEALFAVGPPSPSGCGGGCL